MLRPFIIAWGIWLGGYALLLLLDHIARTSFGARGVSQLQVLVVVSIVAGCAAGYFLAATSRWPMRRRLMMLVIQIPPAYMAAVSLGIAYLCITQQCPF